MSNAQEHPPQEHQSFIKSPKQLIVVAVFAFVVPVVVILMLAGYVARGTRGADGSDAFTPEAVATRIAPVARLEVVDANAPKEFLTGEAVYKQVCAACHTAGVAGAPRTGDKATWEPLIAQGFDALLQVGLHGKGAMPPKGGATNLSDYEVARAVVYLANQSGGQFDEPTPPAAEGEAGAQQQAAAAQSTQGAAPAQAAPSAQGAPAQAAAQAGATSTPVAPRAPEPPADPQAAAQAQAAAAAASAGHAAAKEAEATQAADQGGGAQAAAGQGQAQGETQGQVQQAPAAGQASAEGGGQAQGGGPIPISEAAHTVGKKLYETSCAVCHSTGIAGAPRTGDKAAWAPYIATGMDTMLAVAIKGKGAMPPRGTAIMSSDEELRLAIEYMVSQSQ